MLVELLVLLMETVWLGLGVVGRVGGRREQSSPAEVGHVQLETQRSELLHMLVVNMSLFYTHCLPHSPTGVTSAVLVLFPTTHV